MKIAWCTRKISWTANFAWLEVCHVPCLYMWFLFNIVKTSPHGHPYNTDTSLLQSSLGPRHSWLMLGYSVVEQQPSPVKMFCSSRQHIRSSRQQIPGPLACWRAHSEVQCGVSSKKLTVGGKITGCWHILTGLITTDNLCPLYYISCAISYPVHSDCTMCYAGFPFSLAQRIPPQCLVCKAIAAFPRHVTFTNPGPFSLLNLKWGWKLISLDGSFGLVTITATTTTTNSI